ncbi:MAG TPA: prepilin peptidase [Candidatus Nanoarchaeia archaeon]|nr:type 4 prepilin-like proteins leader peptide-processing enzyme [uncultured archaeon]
MTFSLFTLWLAFFGFVLGAVVGSFLNVVILRVHSGKKLTGRSECPHCRHELSTTDLIPIISFLWLRGRCRYCKKPISWQYPLVEITTGLTFALVFSTFYSTIILSSIRVIDLINLGFTLFFVSVLIVVTVSDLKWGIIPDRIVLPAWIVAFLYQIYLFFNYQSLTVLLHNLAVALSLGLFFFILILVTRGKGMGGGDLKLAILIGLSLGWPEAVVAIFLAFLTGALASVMLILLGKKAFKQTVPFGPFLALGAFFGILFGNELFRFYLNTLGF